MSEETDLIGRQQLEIENLRSGTVKLTNRLMAALKDADFFRADARKCCETIESFIPDNIHYGGSTKDRIYLMVKEIQESRSETPRLSPYDRSKQAA
jgi:hypothetical protein